MDDGETWASWLSMHWTRLGDAWALFPASVGPHKQLNRDARV